MSDCLNSLLKYFCLLRLTKKLHPLVQKKDNFTSSNEILRSVLGSLEYTKKKIADRNKLKHMKTKPKGTHERLSPII